MAEHPYEYSLIALYLSPKAGALPDYTNPQTQAGLTHELGKTANKLPKLISNIPSGGEGWEVNSHSLTFIGGTVVLSMLLQRNRK